MLARCAVGLVNCFSFLEWKSDPMLREYVLRNSAARTHTEELRFYLSHYHLQDTKIKFNLLRNGKPIEIDLIY
jgi:hypothetical protein